MSTASLSSLNPSDIVGAFKTSFDLKRLLGVATVGGDSAPAVYFATERPGTLTAVDGLEVVVGDNSSTLITPLMDGRESRQRQIKIYAASYSSAAQLVELEEELKQAYGRDNIASSTFADGAAYATAISGSDIGGVVAAREFTFTVPSKRFTGSSDDVADAPRDGQTYARQDGQWVLGGSGGGGGVTQAELDTQLAAAAEEGTASSQGYFYQNSHFFANGLTHVGNPDVVEELDVDTDSALVFSSTAAGEFKSFLQASKENPTDATSLDHIYDRSTGIITLYNAKPEEFLLLRLNVDVEPDSDNSSADVILKCTTNSASGGYTFEIEEQLVALNQGADAQYAGVVSIPVFVGDTLSENGTAATIQPFVRLTNTTGDIKPRSLALFIWS